MTPGTDRSRGLAVVVEGPSGSGKSHVMGALEASQPQLIRVPDVHHFGDPGGAHVEESGALPGARYLLTRHARRTQWLAEMLASTTSHTFLIERDWTSSLVRHLAQYPPRGDAFLSEVEPIRGCVDVPPTLCRAYIIVCSPRDQRDANLRRRGDPITFGAPDGLNCASCLTVFRENEDALYAAIAELPFALALNAPPKPKDLARLLPCAKAIASQPSAAEFRALVNHVKSRATYLDPPRPCSRCRTTEASPV